MREVGGRWVAERCGEEREMRYKEMQEVGRK